jgi:polysaccharide deacetylase family sporulation protein PdaB
MLKNIFLRMKNSRHRKTITAAALLVAIVAMFWIVNTPAVVGVSATTRKLPVYRVAREQKLVSLTFDAAWGNEDTQQLIDILGKYGVKATFFVVGEWVDKYPESVKALSDAGHEVMNHSNNHPHFNKLGAAEIASQINTCNDKIEAVTGVRPTLFRAPYGEYDDHVITAVENLGIKTIQWDVDSLDWKDLSAADIQQRVLSRVKPGSICLFHNAALNTPAALPGIIDSLLADGYTVVPVSEIILTGDTYIDNAGEQHPNTTNQ